MYDADDYLWTQEMILEKQASMKQVIREDIDNAVKENKLRKVSWLVMRDVVFRTLTMHN